MIFKASVTIRNFEEKMDKKDKLRIRSEAELQLQSKGLSEIVDLLESQKISFFLGGGTLLGIVREGDFIPWDWDVEIDVKAEEIYPKRKEIIKDLESAGFEVIEEDTFLENRKNLKISAEKYGAKYEILSYYRLFFSRCRKSKKMPARFFEGNERCVLRQRVYPVLSPAKEYLRYNYGNWEIPLKSGLKDDYVTKRSRRRKNKFFKKFKKSLKTIRNERK